MQHTLITQYFLATQISDDRLAIMIGALTQYDIETLSGRPSQAGSGGSYAIRFEDAARRSVLDVSEDELLALQNYFKRQTDPVSERIFEKLAIAERRVRDAQDYPRDSLSYASVSPLRRLV